MSARVHVLENDIWQVGFLPDTGCSTAFGRVRRGREWLDFLRPTPEPDRGDPLSCASYVLLPWSNRIRDARFRFRGRDYAVRRNFGDGTAIHGTARDFAWTVKVASRDRFAAAWDSRTADRPNWPFKFSCRVEASVEGASWTTTTRLRNEDDVPFPAGMGHHPYFQRALLGEQDRVEVEIPCRRYYLAERCLPSAAAVPVEPRVDFRQLRPLGEPFVDDCLTDRASDAPIRFVYPKAALTVKLAFDALYSHVVVYIPTGQTYFAVEPVTHVNDGFNLFEKGVDGTGVRVLEPGEELVASHTFTVTS